MHTLSLLFKCVFLSFLHAFVFTGIQQSSNVLRERYKQCKNNGGDNDEYIPLVAVHSLKINSVDSAIIDKLKELSVGEVQQHHERNITSINNLLVQCETAARYYYTILVEGEPGTGKTRISKEIAFQWANHNLLKSQMLLFLIFIRDPRLKSVTDTNSLVNYFYGSENDTFSNKVVSWLVETDGKYLTVILDGLDEISTTDRNDFINDIISRRKLAKCSLVITSRPATSASLYNIVDFRAEVLYMSEDFQKDIIKNLLQDTNKVNEVDLFLQSNPYLNKVCSVPTTISMLLSLIKDGISTLPKTQYRLAENFILMSINHFRLKEHNLFSAAINSLNDLPQSYTLMIRELSELAYHGLQIDRLVFSRAEIDATCPSLNAENWFGFGLLKVFKHNQSENFNSFHFFHFSIQEYMAGYYITLLPEKTQLKLLTDMFGNIHFLNTLAMYAGISGCTSMAFKHLMSGSSRLFRRTQISNEIITDKIKCIHLLHCLAEADHEMLPQVTKIFEEGRIDLSKRDLSSNDIMTLMFLLRRLPHKQWKEIKLSRCGISDKTCIIFLKADYQSALPRIEFMDISFNKLHWESVRKLVVMMKFWQTKELALSIDELYDSSTKIKIDHIGGLLEEKIRPGFVDSMLRIGLPNVQKNSLANLLTNANAILKGGTLLVTYIATKNAAFLVYSDPDILYTNFFQFGGKYLTDDMIKEVTDFVKNSIKARITRVAFSHIVTDTQERSVSLSRVETVRLYGPNPHSKGAYLLGGTIKIENTFAHFFQYVADYLSAAVCHSFQVGSSYIQTLPKEHVESIKTTIRSYPNLIRIVNVSNSNISSEVADDLTVILSNATLQYFYVQSNQLGPTGASKIVQILRQTSSLIVLDISDNNFGSEAADDLAAALSINTKIQKFNASKNNFEASGGIKVARALQNTSSLTEFVISNNNIGSEAADDLAVVLSHNTKLQVIHMQDNNLQTNGIIKITKALQNTTSLTELDLSGNNISSEASDDIATVLWRNNKLQKFYIKENSLHAVGALKIIRALYKASSLLEFDISSNSIGSGLTDDIAVLSHNTKLQALRIQNNNLAVAGATKIARSLQAISSLTELDISSNNIGYEAANDVAAIISHNVKLQKLCIKENNLQTSGAIEITRALRRTLYLREFDISDNNIGSQAADDVAAVLSHNVKLQKFYAYKNNLETISAVKVLRALENARLLTELDISNNNMGSGAADYIALVLSHNTKLQVLCVGNNDMTTSGVIKIAKALQRVLTLTELDISSNNIDCEAAKDIAAVLSANFKLQKLSIKENNLQTSGAITIAKSLQNTTSLIEVDISSNNIGSKAADDIAAVLSVNVKLQKFYVKENHFHTPDAIKIARALRKAANLREFDISNNNIFGGAAKRDVASFLSHNVNVII